MTAGIGGIVRALAAAGLLAAATLPAQVLDRGNVSGAVAFEGKATLGDFTGRSTAVSGALLGAGRLASVRGWVEFPVRSLDSGNGKRDRDMYKSLEADEHPTIRFEVGGVGVGMADGDSVPVTIRGGLTIKGVSREHAFTGWVWRLDSGNVRFRGHSPLDLKSYQIGGLSKMFGLLKMDREIDVRVDLTFSR
jgi:polyisoprenoid-binding protein YceI